MAINKISKNETFDIKPELKFAIISSILVVYSKNINILFSALMASIGVMPGLIRTKLKIQI